MRLGLGLLAVIALGISGCASKKDVEELKANQEKILEKLAKVGQAPAPQRPRPGRPDPSTVYSWEVGDSATKGPADAWVTIVESSDFQ